MFKCLLFLGAILSLPSCQKPASKPISRPLKVNLPGEPATLDPRKCADYYSSAVQSLLFEGLTKVSEEGLVKNAIADSITVSDDKKTYLFHIREALWSNGDPITAYDFEYSWKSALDPNFFCPNANLLYFIAYAEEAKKGLIPLDKVAINALDAKTLKVTLKAPTPYFLKIVAFCSFYPVSKEVVSKTPGWEHHASANFVSNGPYQLVEWLHDNQLILKKNLLYWNAQEVLLNDIHISLVSDENTALSMFQKGELDILGSPYTNIPIDALEAFKDSKNLQSFPLAKTFIAAFNTRHPILANRNIRKALSYAIDRQSLVANVGGIGETVAMNLVPPALKSENLHPLIPENSSDQANAYLEEGLKELNLPKEALNHLHLTYIKQDFSHKLAQALQEIWWKELGFRVKLEALGITPFLTRINAHEFELCQYHLIAQYEDAMNILDRFRYASNPKNFSNWENTSYIKLLEESSSLPEKERCKTLHQAETILLEEMPLTPLIHAAGVRLVQDDVLGISMSSTGFMYLHRVHFKEKKD